MPAVVDKKLALILNLVKWQDDQHGEQNFQPGKVILVVPGTVRAMHEFCYTDRSGRQFFLRGNGGVEMKLPAEKRNAVNRCF